MARQNIKRQEKLEPLRVINAKNAIEKLGFEITFECNTRIEFEFKNEIVMFFPYSGWHSGKSIKDGRGILNLLKQIKQL